jgi:hypothetical protein
MSEPQPQGKTLWEMARARLRGGAGANGGTLAFANPLDLRVGAPVNVPYANGAEFNGYDIAVREIRVCVRPIGGQDFVFTDYVLRGVNGQTFAAGDELAVRLRVVPNAAGAHDAVLLKLHDEFAFAEDFLAVVRDTTGLFETTDDATRVTDRFQRINDLRDSYEANVLVVRATTEDGQAPAGQVTHGKIEYWDYWRDADIGGGNTAKEFLFVEWNKDTGWFQIWRGREFFA